MASNIAAIITRLRDQLSLGTDYNGIGPVPVPDNATLPYITVQQIMLTKLQSHDGDSGVGPCLMQVNCFDKNYETADALRALVDEALDGLAGVFAGVTSQGANHNHSHDIYDSERELHQCVTRHTVWFERDRV